MYQTHNRITGVTKLFKSRKAARNYADRIDLAYGAIICSVCMVIS